MRLDGDCTKAIQPLLTLVRTSGLTISSKLYPTVLLPRKPPYGKQWHQDNCHLSWNTQHHSSFHSLILTFRFQYRLWRRIEVLTPTVPTHSPATTNLVDSYYGIPLEQRPLRIITPVPRRPIPIDDFTRVAGSEEDILEPASPIILERRPPTPPRRRTLSSSSPPPLLLRISHTPLNLPHLASMPITEITVSRLQRV